MKAFQSGTMTSYPMSAKVSLAAAVEETETVLIRCASVAQYAKVADDILLSV